MDAAALGFVRRNGGLRIGKRLLDAALSGLDAGDDEEARELRVRAGAEPSGAGDRQEIVSGRLSRPDIRASGRRRKVPTLAGRVAGAAPQRQGGPQIGQRAGEVAHAFAYGAAVLQGQSLTVHAAGLFGEREGLADEVERGRVVALAVARHGEAGDSAHCSAAAETKPAALSCGPFCRGR